MIAAAHEDDIDFVDIAALVHPGSATRLHVLHGGAQDPWGVHNCVQYLQRLWSAGVAHIHCADELVVLARTVVVTRTAPAVPLIVVVPVEVVVSACTVYDELCRRAPKVSVVTTVPVDAVDGTQAPYPSRRRIVAIALPSCRCAPLDSLRAAAKVYALPIGGRALRGALAGLPHTAGVGWAAGGQCSQPSYLTMRPGDAVVDQARVDDAQLAVDKTWWWAERNRVRGQPSLSGAQELVLAHTLDHLYVKAQDPGALAYRDMEVGDRAPIRLQDAHVLCADDSIVPVRVEAMGWPQDTISCVPLRDGDPLPPRPPGRVKPWKVAMAPCHTRASGRLTFATAARGPPPPPPPPPPPTHLRFPTALR